MNTSHVYLRVMDSISQAWNLVKGSKATFWGVILLAFIFDILLSAASSVHGNVSAAVSILLAVLIIVFYIFVCLFHWGLIYLGVQRAQGLPIEFAMIKNVFSFKMILKMILLYILKCIVLLPVIILLFVPSILMLAVAHSTLLKIVIACLYIIGLILTIFLLVRMWLAAIYVLTKQKRPWGAIKASFKATKGNVWNLIGLSILNTLIFFVSIIPLGIGLIWSLPYFFINYGVVFHSLKINADE